MTEKQLIERLIDAAAVLHTAPMSKPGFVSLPDIDRHAIKKLLEEAAKSIENRRSMIDESLRGFQDRQRMIDANFSTR
jgi:hypothetical protein